jgi:hypothetical protein
MERVEAASSGCPAILHGRTLNPEQNGRLGNAQSGQSPI